MKFYIASKLKNAEQVRRVASVLKAAGHEHTYDWTTHGNVKDDGIERLREVANNEYNGVKESDMVIVLLPGGRGTHTELGIGIACGCRIILCYDNDDLFQCDDKTCAFYWNDFIVQCSGSIDEWLVKILSEAKKIDGSKP